MNKFIHLLFFFDRAEQRIFVRAGEIHGFLGFHLRDLVRVNPGDADAFIVDFEHDRESFDFGAQENMDENKNDEFHRRKIVVMKENLVKFRLFELRFALGQNLAVVFGIRKFRHKRILATNYTNCTNEKKIISLIRVICVIRG